MTDLAKYYGPFLLICENGETELYETLDALVRDRELNFRYTSEGITTAPLTMVVTFSSDETDKPSDGNLAPRSRGPVRALIRDFYGRAVALDVILKSIEEVRLRSGFMRRLARLARLNTLFRLGTPIPHTGHSRFRGRFYRRPRHIGLYKAGEETSEKAREFGWTKDIKEHRPPNSWDDLIIARKGDRNWKLFRKTKWKRPKVSFRSLNNKDF